MGRSLAAEGKMGLPGADSGPPQVIWGHVRNIAGSEMLTHPARAARCHPGRIELGLREQAHSHHPDSIRGCKAD